MLDYNITAQEISDYNADMLEMSGYIPTDAEMQAMYEDAMNKGLALV
jgi:hypothetical protein